MKNRPFGATLSALLAVWTACGSPQTAQLPPYRSPSSEELSEHDSARSVGIFVGVQEFAEAPEKLADVPFAVDDAVDLAYLFSLELGLIAPERVRLVLAGRPRKAESRARLKSLESRGVRVASARYPTEVYRQLDGGAREAGEDGMLVVAVATHGFTDRGDQYLLASASMLGFVERTAVRAGDLFEIVRRSPARRKLVLLDACRQRLLSRRGGPDPRSAASSALLEVLGRTEGQVVLFGARAGGYALDDSERGNGVFTASILEALRCPTFTEANGYVTPLTLYRVVDRKVSERSRELTGGDPHGLWGVEPRFQGSAVDMPLRYCAPDSQRPWAELGAFLEGTSAFPNLGGSHRVEVGGTFNVEGDLPRGCDGDFWIVFLSQNGDRIWPKLPLGSNGGRFDKTVTPPDGFSGGQVVLACVPREGSKALQSWLTEGWTSPTGRPAGFQVILATGLQLEGTRREP